MILTQCAACAAPLPHLAKQCSRCKTRYCGAACQELHWKEGGHKDQCKKIRRGGGAEQFHADTRYAEAVTVAAEACAADTKGQTCYICTEAVHRHTKEGLVRGCACHTTEGFVHVSCLAEQAKILFAEAEENNLDEKAINQSFNRWHTCSLCDQPYHGVVRCALGWACWKTYLGRLELQTLGMAMGQLANGLGDANHHEDALLVREAELSTMRRYGASEQSLLISQSNLANTYQMLGRLEESISLRRDVYAGKLKVFGEEHRKTLSEANNYANSLLLLKRFKEAKALLRKTILVAQRVLGKSDQHTLAMRMNYAQTLCEGSTATLDDIREAVETLEDVRPIARRVLGGLHPIVVKVEHHLRSARSALRARE